MFGYSLSSCDFDDNGVSDLVVGIPLEDIGAVEDAGAVQVSYGLPSIFADGFESSDTSAWSATVP